TTASLWANVPHYISGIENPKATLALVRRVLPLLGATLDLTDLEDAVKQFDRNLTEIVRQNAKIASYIKKLESSDAEEPAAEPRLGRAPLRFEPPRFPFEHLPLPRAVVDLDPEAERRALAEAQRLTTLFKAITAERLWRGRFTRPVAGTEPGTGFGARRIIN